jgi:hypothetical protein
VIQIGEPLLRRLSESCLKKVFYELLGIGHCFHPALGRMRNDLY